MVRDSDMFVAGELLGDDATISLGQLCHVCQVSTEIVEGLVAEGVIEAYGGTTQQWYFQVVSVRRVQRAVRLGRDLGVNTAGVALALDLLDELDAARAALSFKLTNP